MVFRRLKTWNADSVWWHWTFFVDWALAAGVGLASALILLFTRPFCRDFDPLDKTIAHPFTEHETFPSWTVAVLGLILPWFVGGGMAVWSHRSRGTPRDDLKHQLHTLGLCLAQAVMLATLFTTAAKQYAGRYRPDFISRLRRTSIYDPATFNATDPTAVAGLLGAVCASDDHAIIDGRRSFPSGHSSFMFAGWTVTMFFMASALNFKQPLYGFANLVLAMVPVALPAWVAISRTVDYRHGFADVLSGSIVGMVFALAAFRRHFHFRSATPYNRNAWVELRGTADSADGAEEQDMDDAASLSISA